MSSKAAGRFVAALIAPYSSAQNRDAVRESWAVSAATRTMLVSVIALVVGAFVATGAYALIDGTDSGTQATKYIVVEQQAQGSAEIPGKNEATTAAAISPQTGVASPDEAGGIASPPAAEALRTDPRGPAISLRNP